MLIYASLHIRAGCIIIDWIEGTSMGGEQCPCWKLKGGILCCSIPNAHLSEPQPTLLGASGLGRSGMVRYDSGSTASALCAIDSPVRFRMLPRFPLLLNMFAPPRPRVSSPCGVALYFGGLGVLLYFFDTETPGERVVAMLK